MVNLNELRIGSMIYPNEAIAKINGEYVIVVGISEDGSIETTSYFFDGMGCQGTLDVKCFGIPLTPEILEKCGFGQDGEEFSQKFIGRVTFKLELNTYSNEVEYFRLEIEHNVGMGFDYIIRPPEFLHQLQNIIHSLTGEELTYTP